MTTYKRANRSAPAKMTVMALLLSRRRPWDISGDKPNTLPTVQ